MLSIKKIVLILLFCCCFIELGFEKVLFKKNPSQFNIQILYCLAVRYSLDPDLLVKQAILETGWFSSDLFLSYNNLFGMKFSKSSFVKGSTKSGGYAVYDCWLSSFFDYIRWEKLHKGKTNKTKLKIYAKDSQYLKKVKRIRYKHLL